MYYDDNTPFLSHIPTQETPAAEPAEGQQEGETPMEEGGEEPAAAAADAPAEGEPAEAEGGDGGGQEQAAE